MSDLYSRQRALDIMRKIHPEHGPLDKMNNERPDIQFRDDGVGIEVTRAYSEQEGRFYANARCEIRNPGGMFHNVLSTGHICLMEDTNDIMRRVSDSIDKKTTMAAGYRNENSWMKKLSLAIIVGYDLERSDFGLVLSKINAEARNAFDEIVFIMPSSALLFKTDNDAVILFL
jgi:hypothetical protein